MCVLLPDRRLRTWLVCVRRSPRAHTGVRFTLAGVAEYRDDYPGNKKVCAVLDVESLLRRVLASSDAILLCFPFSTTGRPVDVPLEISLAA